MVKLQGFHIRMPPFIVIYLFFFIFFLKPDFPNLEFKKKKKMAVASKSEK